MEERPMDALLAYLTDPFHPHCTLSNTLLEKLRESFISREQTFVAGVLDGVKRLVPDGLAALCLEVLQAPSSPERLQQLLTPSDESELAEVEATPKLSFSQASDAHPMLLNRLSSAAAMARQPASKAQFVVTVCLEWRDLSANPAEAALLIALLEPETGRSPVTTALASAMLIEMRQQGDWELGTLYESLHRRLHIDDNKDTRAESGSLAAVVHDVCVTVAAPPSPSGDVEGMLRDMAEIKTRLLALEAFTTSGHSLGARRNRADQKEREREKSVNRIDSPRLEAVSLDLRLACFRWVKFVHSVVSRKGFIMPLSEQTTLMWLGVAILRLARGVALRLDVPHGTEHRLRASVETIVQPVREVLSCIPQTEWLRGVTRDLELSGGALLGDAFPLPNIVEVSGSTPDGTLFGPQASSQFLAHQKDTIFAPGQRQQATGAQGALDAADALHDVSPPPMSRELKIATVNVDLPEPSEGQITTPPQASGVDTENSGGDESNVPTSIYRVPRTNTGFNRAAAEDSADRKTPMVIGPVSENAKRIANTAKIDPKTLRRMAESTKPAARPGSLHRSAEDGLLKQTVADAPALTRQANVSKEKWTFQRLCQSKNIKGLVDSVVTSLREEFRLLYDVVRDPQVVEVLLLVDNSGSMSIIRPMLFETLAIVMESMRRVELRFAVARFGKKQDGVRFLKSMDEPMSYERGQYVLEAFTFNEGTNPATCFQLAAEKAWEKVDHPNNVRRFTVMMTDGMSGERGTAHMESVMETKRTSLHVLEIYDEKNKQARNFTEDIQRLPQNADSSPYRLRVTSVSDPSKLHEAVRDVLVQILVSVRGLFANRIGDPGVPAPALAAPPDLTSEEANATLKSTEEFMPVSISGALESGGGGDAFLRTACRYSANNSALPRGQLVSKSITDEERGKRRAALHDHLTKMQAKKASLARGLPTQVEDAKAKWAEAERKLRSQIEDMVRSMEDLFPCNKFTRKRGDVRGSSLYLPGLIKAVCSDWTYKKYLASLSQGGRRRYSVAIAVDVSQSMSGHLIACARESLIVMMAALGRIGLDFSLLVFGTGVSVLKGPGDALDGATKLLLLNALFRCDGQASLDAPAVDTCVDLLEAQPGPRRAFVMTDGYGSCGLAMTRSLALAAEPPASVQVIGVGVGYDRLFVSRSFQHWVLACIPTALPEALKLFSNPDRRRVADDLPVDNFMLTTTDEPIDMKTVLEIEPVFSELVKELQDERTHEMLLSGGLSSSIDVDVAFVVDVTASMASYRTAIWLLLTNFATLLTAKLQSYIGVNLRMGLVMYGDIDPPRRNVTTRPLAPVQPAEEEFRRLVPVLAFQGGGDCAEDVAGGIEAAAGLEWRPEAVRFAILLCDAPGHGPDLCNEDDEDADNRVFATATNGTAKQLLEKLGCISRPRNGGAPTDKPHLSIRLALASFNPARTQKMEQAFATAAADFHDDDKPTIIALHPQPSAAPVAMPAAAPKAPAVLAGPFHFIFCLDSSDSMADRRPSERMGRRWDRLMPAFEAFVKPLADRQATEHLISVILFNQGAVVVESCKRKKPHEMQRLMASLKPLRGDTNFVPALEKASVLINEESKLSPAAARQPVLIFMSDGRNDDGRLPIAAVEALKFKGAPLKPAGYVHTILFGSDSDGEKILRSMASDPKRFHKCENADTLYGAFIKIVQEYGPSQAVTAAVTDAVVTEIAARIHADYL